MSSFAKLWIYVAATLLFGALLAPWLYWGGKAFVQWPLAETLSGWPVFDSLLHSVGKAHFPRYFNRAVLIAALLLMVPLVWWLRRSPAVEERGWGLAPNARGWGDGLWGFGLAFVPLAMMAGVLVAMGHYSGRVIPGAAWIVGIVMTAVVVAILEEVIFRGLILGMAQRSLSRGWSIGLVALLFAVIHFLKVPSEGVAPPEFWSDGLALLPVAFAQFAVLPAVVGEFFTLLAIGWVLGIARVHTRSLALPIGLHAGWIFAHKLFSGLTQKVTKDLSPWVGQDWKSGVVPLVIVMATGVVMWQMVRNRREG